MGQSRNTFQNNTRVWISRLLIGVVTAWNLQAAITFMVWPDSYTPGFELSGIPGEAALRGTGILFLMWNLPYLVALFNPVRYKLVLKIDMAMQLTGVLGETCILFTLPETHAVLHSSLLRFIAFDGTGLILLVLSYLFVRKEKIP